MKEKLFVDQVFDWCVKVLIYWAKILGISYNEINVYLFCILLPILTFILIGIILYQWIAIRKLNAKLKDK